MSIDDDIFDVQDAMKDTDVEKSFDRIIKLFNEMETSIDKLTRQNKILKDSIKTFMDVDWMND